MIGSVMKGKCRVYRKGWFITLALMCTCLMATGQDTGRRKTIDITSSFKPSLLSQQKMGFTASAATGDTTRAALSYQLPGQNLVLQFAPAPLRPLAYQQEQANLPADPSVFLKLGYGNFSSPLVQALASMGDGKKMNGNVEAGYRASRGKIDFQEWQQYGAKGNLWLHMKNNSALHFSGGYTGTGTYRYGFEPKTVPVGGDSLRVRYNLAELGAALANPVAGPAGITYDARLKGHYFSDNAQGQETALQFDLPLTKKISETASFGLGIKGMVSSFSGADTSFSNNLFTIPVWARVKLKENMHLRAGIIPSWNNEDFRLLPDIDFEYLLKDNNMVVQAGFKGYFDEQTFRSLAGTNPWIRQPGAITSTQNTEVYAALKTHVTEFLSYRVKAGVGTQRHVPLFINGSGDGRYFEVLWEPQLSRVFLSGELTYKKGDKLNWNTTVLVNGYSKVDVASKPYGLLPFELRSSVQWLIVKDLRFRGDVYAFNGAWYRTPEGETGRGKSAFDLNAGVDFSLHPKVRLWLQLNNILNVDYQRWNQYRVLGFQALGGVSFHL